MNSDTAILLGRMLHFQVAIGNAPVDSRCRDAL